MSVNAPVPPQRVPTLTEVVAWPQADAPAQVPARPLPPAAAQMPAAGPAGQLPLPVVEAGPAEADLLPMPMPPLRMAEEQMIQGVLAEVQRQVDLMLDYRLREALTPLLNRAADGIVRDARAELASTLRDVVARAVAQELSRHRTR